MHKIARNKLNIFLIILVIVVVTFGTSLFFLGFFTPNKNSAQAYTVGEFDVVDVYGGLEIALYKGTSTGAVNIPETLDYKRVVSISQTAFNNKTITSVTIPRYVSQIGSYTAVNTFNGCTNLSAINVDANNDYYQSNGGVLYSKMKGIPCTLIKYPIKKTDASYTVLANTKYIGSGAFMGNVYIGTITLVTSLTDIGNFAFQNCSNITTVNIPVSVTYLGDFAFENCTKLSTVTINSKNISIGSYAFRNTALGNVTNNVFYSAANGNKWLLGSKGTVGKPFNPGRVILTVPADVVGIANNALSAQVFPEVVFASGSVLEVIGEGAFNSCPYLTAITLPASTKRIGAHAFSNNNLTTVAISSTSIEFIGNSAFSDNKSLTSLVLPSIIKTIGDGAFSGCTSLSTCAIPTSVTKIGMNAFMSTARYNNAANNALVNFDNWIVGAKGTIPAVPSFANVVGIADRALESKISTTNSTITLPATLKYIGEYAFASNTGLTTLSIPASVEYIEPYAFSGCQNLKSITFGSGIKRIGEGAFKNSMSNVTASNDLSISIPNTVTDIGDEAFSGAIRLSSVAFVGTSTLKNIGNYAFANCSNTNFSSITIPTSVEAIGWFAFEGSRIYALTANNNIVYAGNWAVGFKGDKATQSTITFANNIRGIAAHTLSNMPSLFNVIIPSSVERLGDYAFYMCYGLQQVMISRNSVVNGGQTIAGEGIFNNTNTNGYVYPTNVTAYKAMENWTLVSNRISALADVTVATSTGGTVSQSTGYYFPNDNISMTASPNSAYYFEGWDVGGTIASRSLGYNLQTVAGSKTYTAKFLSITTGNQTTTYSGNTVAATFTPAATFTSNTTYSPGGVVPKDVNTYTATVNVMNNLSQLVGSKNVTIQITPKSLAITANAASKVYGSSDPTLTYAQSGIVAGDQISGSLTRAGGENVSSYAILQGSLSAGINYTISYTGNTFSITKKGITVTAQAKSKVYGNSDPAFTFTASGLVGSDTVGGSQTRTAGDVVGTYSIAQGSLSAGGNYTISYTPANLTITRRPIGITAVAASKTYGQSDPASFGYTITSGSFGYTDNSLVGALARAVGENAGNYAISQGTVTNTNNGNYDISFVSKDFTINRASATISGTATQTFTYGKDTKNIVASLSHSETAIVYSPYQGRVDVGSYTITATSIQTTNYNSASATFTLKINPKAITVSATAGNKTYGDSDPVLGYSITGLVSGDQISGSQTRAAGENVNTYAISQGTLSAGNNYTITYTGGTFTIKAKTLAITAQAKSKVYGESDPAFTYTSSGLVGSDKITGSQTRTAGNTVGNFAILQGTLAASANYSIVYTVANLTITRRPIGITAVAASKIYGQSDPASFGYTITSGSYGYTDNSLVGALSRAAGENAGSYAITQGTVTNANNSNYDISFVAKNFTINRAEAIISGESIQGFVYNKSVRNISATLNHSETTLTYSPYQGRTDVGSYTITANSEQTTNYNAKSVVFTLNVTPKGITINANPISKTYGDSDPTLSYTTIGLEAGDTTTGAQNRAAGESVNSYAITQGTLSAGTNYTITYTGNIFTITRRAVTLSAEAKTKTYGNSDPAFTYSIKTGNLVFSDVLVGNQTRVAGENVGNYAINQGTITNANNPNYNITYNSANLEITKRAIGIKANSKSKIYGEADVSLDYAVISGSYGNNDTILVGALVRDLGENVNTYTINSGTITNANNSNYDIAYTSNSFTITKRALTIKADNKSIIYGDNPPIYTITYIGRVNNDVIAGDASSNYTKFNDASTYTISVDENTFTNYNPTYISATLTVNKKAVTITADNKTVTYGDIAPTYTISYVGIVNNDNLLDTASSSYKIYDNASDYTINVNAKVYTNYAPIYKTGTLTVQKKAVTITAEDKQVIYGNSLPTFTFFYNGLINNDKLVDTASTPYNLYDDIGKFAIQVDAKVYTNYTPTYIDGELEVVKRTLFIEVDDLTIPYGSPKPEFTFSYTGLVNDDDLGDNAFTNYNQYDVVGTYYLTVITQTYTNYVASYKNGILEVVRAAALISGNTNQPHIYDSSMKYIEASLNHSETTLNYSPAQGYKNAGSYPITITSVQTQNYLAGSITFNLIINQKQIIISSEAKQKIYGESDPELTYTVVGMIAGEVLTGDIARQQGEDVDVYTIEQGTLSAGANYDLVYESNTFTIIQRFLEISADSQIKTYGYDDPTFTYVITGGNLVGNDKLYGLLSREDGIYVGDYEILVGSLDNSNYNITYISNYLQIIKRPITITANDMQKYYGDVDPDLTYSITFGSLAYDDTISAAIAREDGENVGEYPIVIAQTENNSYDISYQGNMFSIVRRPVTVSAHNKTKIYGDTDPELTYYLSEGNLGFDDELAGNLVREIGENKNTYTILQGTLNNDTNANYDISYVSNEFIIEARELTLLAADKTKIYGDADPVLTYVISQGNLVFGDELVGNISRVAGENVGGYRIEQGTILNSNNTNYDITFITKTLTISRRPITITANAFGKVYGYNDPSLPYGITEGNLVFADLLSGTLTREKGENIGEYRIYQGTLDNASNKNYDISFVENDFTIEQRKITVFADNMTRVYGDNDPVLTYNIIGGSLAFGDTLNGSLEREQGESLGQYLVEQGTIQNDINTNYDITFQGNFFSIIERPITISSVFTEKTYGGEDPELLFIITQGSMAFDDVLNGVLEREIGEIVAEYIINCGTITNENNSNYNIDYVGNVFRINRRPITITPLSQTKTYGYNDPTLNYNITQGELVMGDSLTGNLGREPGENVGVYEINYGTLNDNTNLNYQITLVTREFTIEKRLVVITADNKSKIYGNSDPAYSYGIFSGSLIEGDSLTGSLSREKGENAGLYPMSLGTLENPNYELVIVSGILIINPKPIIIEAKQISFLHGSKTEIDLEYIIQGNPLPGDEEEIATAIRISSAPPDAEVGTYPINLTQIKPLNNYTITLVNSTLNIEPGIITGIEFEDRNVLYDGYEHTINLKGMTAGYTISYRNNTGTEVGVYLASAVVKKENYNDLVLNARLVIMTNRITTAEMIPEGIFTMTEGVDPYVIPVIKHDTDENILVLAQGLLNDSEQEKEMVKSIINISLYNNGNSVALSGNAEVKMLLPKGINDLESLRIVHITDTLTYDVAFEISGDYVIFTAEELGYYAFITGTEPDSTNEWIIQTMFYGGMGVLGLIFVAVIISGFSGARKKKNASKFL